LVQPTNENRRLVLLRHAKSAWPDVPDDQRPLAARGRRDAPEAGRWLHGSGRGPDQVLCSPARRARETWQLAATALDPAPPVDFDPRIYQADVELLLGVLREVPGHIGTLLVVGHEPTMRELTLHLADDEPGGGSGGGSDALQRVRLKFPTSAIAVLDLPGPWAALDAGGGRLTDFVIPRG
jgi:phosphohistidine phosphatase